MDEVSIRLKERLMEMATSPNPAVQMLQQWIASPPKLLEILVLSERIYTILSLCGTYLENGLLQLSLRRRAKKGLRDDEISSAGRVESI
jgi:hypothetical protein